MPVPATTAPPRALLRESTYRAIRDAIVEGTLAPGERLRDAELERWLGVSRTPVREALTRLEHLGLVHTRPGHSTTVAPLDARAARHAQTVAAALHELAVREGSGQLGPDDLVRLRAHNAAFADALAEGDPDAAITADDAFHEVFVAAAANPVIAATLDQVTPVLRRLERARFTAAPGRDSVAQHEHIVGLLETGEVEAAAVAARDNWLTLDPFAAGTETGPEPEPADADATRTRRTP